VPGVLSFLAYGTMTALGLVAIGATEIVRPEIYRQLLARPWAWPLALLALAGLIGAPWLRDLPAFIASSAFLAGTRSFVKRPMKRSVTAPAATSTSRQTRRGTEAMEAQRAGEHCG
jgi:hypothetical protein